MIIGSGIADIIDTANLADKYIKPIMFVASILMLTYAFYFIKNRTWQRSIEKENTSLIEKVGILEREICEGVKFSLNHVDVTFDLKNKCYKFSFTKEYQILSQSAKWFSAQFYCNNDLENSEESRKYYQDNPITWDDINIEARLIYKNSEEEVFSANQDLKILRVAEGINYKQFHIQYETIDDDKLDIRTGAEIKLTYCYTVPTRWWGSYLNRTTSYFGEDATVAVKCKTKDKLNNSDLKQYSLDPLTGEPKIIIPKEMMVANKVGDHFCRELRFPSSPFGKYRLSWDANIVFDSDNLNTKNGLDASQLTKF